MDETPTFSVTEVCNGIGQMITTAFPDEFWVRGQVSGLSRPRSGHLYLDLVDADGDGGRTVPVLKVNLWAGRRTAIDRQLADAGVELVDGVEVRIRGRLDFYPPQARVSFIMSAIDPAFTLGQLAENRDRILRALHAEGLLRAQERLTVPLVPLDVALVTSQGSAAEADFLHELGRSGHTFHVRPHPTLVQGTGSVASVCRSLREAAATACDVIALVRGGGSATDLQTFDTEDVARTIAGLDVVVWTGIGHEVDRSVADEVAHTAFKTPTACAAGLVEAVDAFIAELGDRWDGIALRAERHLDRAADTLDRRSTVVGERAARVLLHAEREIRERGRRVARDGRTALARAEADLRVIEASAVAADPVRALARGWSITRTADGRLVRSVGDAPAGTELTTLLADGSVRSTVHADGT